jgi:DNA-binding GntR family transcriptional regulator
MSDGTTPAAAPTAPISRDGDGRAPSRLSEVVRDPSLPLGDAVHAAISQALQLGLYRPGARLVEGELAQELSVSRTPVRDALHRLEVEGLVRSVHNRGFVVADLDSDAAVVFAIRGRLEGLAAALAARHITVPELEALDRLQGQMERIVADPEPDVDALIELNYAFHHAVNHASRSERLERLISRLHPQYVSYQVIRLYDGRERRRSIEEHRATLDALWRRDHTLADRLIQAHLEHGKEAVLRRLGPAEGSDGERNRASPRRNGLGSMEEEPDEE